MVVGSASKIDFFIISKVKGGAPFTSSIALPVESCCPVASSHNKMVLRIIDCATPSPNTETNTESLKDLSEQG